jgi:hypothetical protein
MYDSEFKNFTHLIGENNKIYSNGQQIYHGYSPDLAISNSNDEIIYLIENERKSDRKAFLGDIMKASYFCEKIQCSATLIIIMKESGNQTTISQISTHLKEYYLWLKKLGASYLNNVLIMTDDEYAESVDKQELLGSKEFTTRCISLS